MNLNMGMCTGNTNAITAQGLTEIYLPPMKLKGVRSPRATSGRPTSSIHLVAEPSPRGLASPRGDEKRSFAPEDIAKLKQLEVELSQARGGDDGRGPRAGPSARFDDEETTSSSPSSKRAERPAQYEDHAPYDSLKPMCPPGFANGNRVLCAGCRTAREMSVEGLYEGRRGNVLAIRAQKSKQVSSRSTRPEFIRPQLDSSISRTLEEICFDSTMAPACRECFPHYYDWSSTYANVGHDAAMGEQLNGARIVTPFGIVTYSSTDAQPRARSVAQENEDENSCDDDPLVHQVNRQVTEEYSRTQEPYNRVGIQLPDEERGEVCSISSSVALAVDEVNRQIRSEMPLKGLCGGPCLQSPKHDDFQTTMPLVPSVHRGQDLRDEGLLEEKQVVPGSTGLRCCEPEFVRVPPEMERQRSSRLLQAISPRNMCSNVFEDVQPDFMAEYDVPIPA